MPDPFFEGAAAYQFIAKLLNGEKVWLAELSGPDRALFLATGALDFPAGLVAGDVQPPPPQRVRMRFVDGSLQIVDTLGAITSLTPADVDEVVLTFPSAVAPGTAINIQTGAGAGPATVEGDTLTLPATGAEFKSDGRWLVFLNGQQLKRGNSVADNEINWASSVQVSVNATIRPGNELTIRKVM